MSYSRIVCEDAYRQALALCRGHYQEAVIRGSEALSGATLRGRAASYSARYRESRQNLLYRMTRAGIPWREERGAHGKRILVIGDEAIARIVPDVDSAAKALARGAAKTVAFRIGGGSCDP